MAACFDQRFVEVGSGQNGPWRHYLQTRVSRLANSYGERDGQ
jgi:hypothetical protein